MSIEEDRINEAIAARRLKMQAILESRQKRSPVAEEDQKSSELARIREALETTEDVEAAAELLTERGHKISRAGLYRRVKVLGIDLKKIFARQK